MDRRVVIVTLLVYILSLALSFVCSNYEECENIRKIEYVYQDYAAISATATDASFDDEQLNIDYIIVEKLTFANQSGGFDVVENSYVFPRLEDRNVHDWQMAVNLLARERGVEIKEFKDDVAVGYISQEILDAYMDVYKDGYANDLDSFDYLDERELSEQRTRYTYIYVSFSIFLMSAKMLNKCLRTFIGRKGVS